MTCAIEKGLKAGFFRYLSEPVKINEFLNALDDALIFSERGLVNESIDIIETVEKTVISE